MTRGLTGPSRSVAVPAVLGGRGRMQAALAAGFVAIALAGGSAQAAATFCGGLGLTKGTVRQVFGPGLKLSLQPNQGDDLGVCLIARRGQVFTQST